MRTNPLPILLICAMCPAAAFGGDSFSTGNKLFGYCNDRSESCSSYIAGVVDSLLMVGITTKAPMICPANNIELTQAVDVIMNYLRSHPKTRQVSAASMATVALMKAFPCGR